MPEARILALTPGHKCGSQYQVGIMLLFSCHCSFRNAVFSSFTMMSRWYVRATMVPLYWTAAISDTQAM